jgi:hypothetical protein
VRDSAGLAAGERRANLAGSFVARPGRPVGDAVLVLVDDVVTSGATLTEAAAVLAAVLAAERSDGAVPVLAAVVAATPRPVPVTLRAGTRAAGADGRDRGADRLSVPEEGD